MNSLLGRGIPYRPKMTVDNKNKNMGADKPAAPTPKRLVLKGGKKGETKAAGNSVRKPKKKAGKKAVAPLPAPAKVALVRIQRNDPRYRKSQLALLFQTLHAYPLPRQMRPSALTWKAMKGVFNATTRPKICQAQMQILGMLANKSDLAARALKALTDRSGVVVMRAGPRGQFGFSFVDLEPGGYNGPLEATDSLESASHELGEMAGHDSGRIARSERRQYGNMVKRLEDELLQEEAESNTIAAAYLANLLEPCETPNIGIPDEENRSLSAKLRVRTLMVAPVASGKCFFRVSRNPVSHINVGGSGGSGTVLGPRLTNVSSTGVGNAWNDQHGDQILHADSYLVANKRTTAKANLGYVGTAWADEDIGFHRMGSHDPKISLESVTIQDKLYDYLPIAAGDVVGVTGQTNDTTPNNYTLGAVFILQTAGVYSVSSPVTTTTTGGIIAGQVTANLTAPANTVGFYEYYIQNNGAGSQFSFASIVCFLTVAALPAWYPIGSSDLQDIDLLSDYADDVRTVGCRATATYIGEKLEGGWIVGGQLPLPGDFDLPDPTLADIGTLLQMEPKALNDENAGMSFPILPMTKESADYAPLGELYGKEDFGEGIMLFQSTSSATDVVIIQTETSICARTERQTMSVSPGPVSLLALSKAQTFLGRINPLDLVTGNDNHEETAHEVTREFSSEHVTWNILPGWFSGNSAEVRDSNVAV